MATLMLDSASENVGKGPSGPSPRFLQIADSIRRQIKSDELLPHAPLPSERSIAEDQGVSRMTARRALDSLETEGLVYSADRRGRFVSPKRLSYDVSNMVSFVVGAQNSAVELEIEVIEVRTGPASADIAAHLEIDPEASVHEYTRLFRSGGHAIFLETEYVAAARFPDFATHDLKQSTTRLLETRYQAHAHTGDIVIRMRGVLAHEAPLLGLSARHSAIEMEQVIRDEAAVPFCFGRQLWRGELAEFSARAIVKTEPEA